MTGFQAIPRDLWTGSEAVWTLRYLIDVFRDPVNRAENRLSE